MSHYSYCSQCAHPLPAATTQEAIDGEMICPSCETVLPANRTVNEEILWMEGRISELEATLERITEALKQRGDDLAICLRVAILGENDESNTL